MWIFLANLPDSRSLVRLVRLSILFGVSFITPEWNIKKCIFIKLFITWYTTVANRRYRYHVENSKVESRKFQVKENRPETVNQVRYANKQNCATIYIETPTHAHMVFLFVFVAPPSLHHYRISPRSSISMIRFAFYRLRYLLVRMAILWLNFCSCSRNSIVKEWIWVCVPLYKDVPDSHEIILHLSARFLIPIRWNYP